ncbi:3-oxoacyl-reductase [Massariosphaeria phaeospora]|uniref:3-oxoacyl-reductase n=1 Tax=Massariosphaeria phaeospora TaxID=100035 RepID=A0A7C8IBS6_9PLEO|nr:3-oxoacyl-reductase [Massariosphaeria phaeospora]
MFATPSLHFKPLRVLVTGGARGIGRGLFRHFVCAGHDVIMLDSNQVELDHVRADVEKWAIPAQRGTCVTMECDLRNREAIKEVVQGTGRIFHGELDVLINNAFATPHIWSKARAMDDPSEDIMAELCVPLLMQGGGDKRPGCIINMSSTRAYQSEMDHEAYSAIKAGMLGLTQSTAVSLGHRHKIRVNAIIPGWINVDNENKAAGEQDKKWEEGLTEQDMKWHPAGRVGKVEDIVKAVEYLVVSDFVTGQEVIVDGGVSRKMVYPE